MPDPSNTYKKAGLWRSLKDIWNEPTGLPGSAASREAGREARSQGQEQECNPYQDEKESTGWNYGWVVEDGRAARANDPSSRHRNHHQDEFWRLAWDHGWTDQDGWLAAGAGQDRSTNPQIPKSDGSAITSWDRGWLRCQEDMKDCRKEGASARARKQPRDGANYPFEHLTNSWTQGWHEEDTKVKQQEENRRHQAALQRQKEQERAEQQRRMEREQREQEARLKQYLAQRIIELSKPDNDYAVKIESARRVMREMIAKKEVSQDEVLRVDTESRLDKELFNVVKKLNDLARQDGVNTPDESELIDCYLGPSPEHFNQHELAVRRTLCLVFMRYLDHYPAEQVYGTLFPIRNIFRKLLG